VIAAIYARKSTHQERGESVEPQEQCCRELATAQGWHVDDRYVFVDKAVSGAEFAKRPGLQALLETLAQRPVPVQLLLVTDKDRLGREQIETSYLLKQFARAGVRVVETTTGRPIALATPTDKVLLSVTSFAAEVERDQARQRTHQALLLKARQRQVTGGRVFGYCCGATLHVRSRSHGRRRAFFYGCTAHHHRGPSVCRNDVELPMVETDEALLTTFEAQLLHPEVVQQAIREAVAQLSAASDTPPARAEAICEELSTVTAKLDRLTQAVVLGGDLPSLVAEIKALERRRAYLEAEVQNLEHVGGLRATDLQALEPELLMRLEDWRALFRRHVMEARQMLGKVLSGRVVFTPRATGAAWAVEYAAECSLGKLVSGILVPKAVVAPTGLERFRLAIPLRGGVRRRAA
jgi:DNA invertase Pin-like site-specific DNA recombinase